MGYTTSVKWRVMFTSQFHEWLQHLDVSDQDRVLAAVNVLSERGPTLGRPFVDAIKTSRHANMKELRPQSSSIRVLFAFDPERTAILLLGGDKAGAWKRWYERSIPVADDLFDEHLRRVASKGDRE
jgi:hypothetical protein